MKKSNNEKISKIGGKKTSKKGGRPSKFDEATVRKLEESFKRDATVEEACSYAGISRETFYQRYNKNNEFSDKIEQSRNFPHMLAKTKFFEALNSKDPNLSFKAALEFLRRRNPERKDKAENVNMNNNYEGLSEDDMDLLNSMRNKLNE